MEVYTVYVYIYYYSLVPMYLNKRNDEIIASLGYSTHCSNHLEHQCPWSIQKVGSHLFQTIV